jgi:hypothetical protein
MGHGSEGVLPLSIASLASQQLSGIFRPEDFEVPDFRPGGFGQ